MHDWLIVLPFALVVVVSKAFFASGPLPPQRQRISTASPKTVSTCRSRSATSPSPPASKLPVAMSATKDDFETYDGGDYKVFVGR